jgi:hypothetical protein
VKHVMSTIVGVLLAVGAVAILNRNAVGKQILGT